MDDVMRKAVEQRAFALWEAGRPEGSGLLYWLLAELELGVIRKVDPCDPFVTLHELAVAARLKGDAVGALQRLVDKCPATAERLPRAAGETRSARTWKARPRGVHHGQTLRPSRVASGWRDRRRRTTRVAEAARNGEQRGQE